MGTLQSSLHRVGSDLAAKGEEGRRAVSLVPLVIEARSGSTRMRFYLAMRRPVKEQVVDALPKQWLVTDGQELVSEQRFLWWLRLNACQQLASEEPLGKRSDEGDFNQEADDSLERRQDSNWIAQAQSRGE